LKPGVLLTLSAYPQCSHWIHIRDWSHFQFHVSFPQFGHVSGRAGLGATHVDFGGAAIGAREPVGKDKRRGADFGSRNRVAGRVRRAPGTLPGPAGTFRGGLMPSGDPSGVRRGPPDASAGSPAASTGLVAGSRQCPEASTDCRDVTRDPPGLPTGSGKCPGALRKRPEGLFPGSTP